MEFNWIMEAHQRQHPDPIPVETHQCNLVGGSGLIVQIVLGLLSFTVLVYKKIYEKPQRPFKIWILDSSKQVLSSLFAHLANMIFSIILTNTGGHQKPILPPTWLYSPARYIYGSNQTSNLNQMNGGIPDEQNDPCNYYFITVIIDTSMGVFLSCFILSKLDLFLKRRGCEQLRTGNYYKESKIHKRWKLVDEEQNEMNVPIEDINYIEIDYLAWLIQLAIWLSITFTTKMILFLLQALFKQPLGFISYCMLFWLNSLPFIKLVFVMIFVPTIMNGLQFWIQDNVLKKKSYSADTEDIEEVESENALIRKNLEFDEAFPNEEQYSTQFQKHRERAVSFLQTQANNQQLCINNADTVSQLHNVSFSKTYKDNVRKDSITLGGSQTEIPMNYLNGQKLDSIQQISNEIEMNSQLNKGFILSNINTPINSEVEAASTNFGNVNQNKNNPQNNKAAKFSQFKDAMQFDHSYTTETLSKDFTSKNIQQIQHNQRQQPNFNQEISSNIIPKTPTN